jgi:hypothetical protein
VESVDEGDKVTPICDPRVKNATLAEIVQWVWEKYYAHLEQENLKEYLDFSKKHKIDDSQN